MRFLPHTEADIAAMLEVVGAATLDDLIAHVPAELRKRATIDIAPGAGEQQVAASIAALAALNHDAVQMTSFLGAGCYRHYVPAAVRSIISRAEFATSYTPYQAEASQGTLQAIFEFQTLITQLTGLEVANASMYDGASAAAEAVLMAHRLAPSRTIIAVSRALWPDYRAAIRTYLSALRGVEVIEVGFDGAGSTDIEALVRLAGPRLLGTIVGYPNMFGIIEPFAEIAEIAHGAGGLAISVTAEALALGLLKSPGELGADIAVGEGQSFGMPVQFGGPGVGFMAARSGSMRQMPGRLVGQTHDRNGTRCFSLTLATREQHIRRERATSNICTNHSLCALAATVYLSLLGRQGLRDLASLNVELTHDAAARLEAAGIAPRFSGRFFNEFVVRLRNPAAAIRAAERSSILAGVPLGGDYPELSDCVLISVTELNSADDFARLADVLAEVV